MSRFAVPSDNLVAVVRRYFGISQAEMAGFLGISQGQLANIEAGRRMLSAATRQRLSPLADLLPATGPPAIEPPPEPHPALPAAPAPGPLAARHRFCVWKARNLRFELQALHQKAAVGLRWQVALPALLAALPPAAPDAPDLPAPDATPATRAAWLRLTYPRQLAQLWATAFTPDDAARYHLLRLQAEALEMEAAALAELLEG